VTRPDDGRIVWQGTPVEIQNPAQARRLGIGMVFQHFSLFEALTVEENIALGLNDAKDRVGLRARIIAVSGRYGLPADPGRTVHDLSVGERQRIEIVRCLLQKPKLLIMDEPTSVLTPQEAETLFATLRRLAAEGCSILYISHKLEEVRALCAAATIMRLGRVVARCDPQEKTARELASVMISAELKPARARRTPPQAGKPRLVLDRLTLRATSEFGTSLHAISLSVAGGEIVGIAGIAGNGQSELMAALSGETLAGRPETVLLDGVAAGHMGPYERRRLGGCFVPEERNGHAAVPTMSLADNAFLSGHLRGALVRLGVIDRRRTQAFADRIIARFDVRTTGNEAAARSLSGGNLQKFLVGREVLLNPAVLVISQPTWGVDAGAALAIHEAIIALATEDAAVVIISQDLDEIFLLADRIAVIAAGRLSEPIPAADASLERIGLLMGGVAAHAPHA
jgi:simple sugar transport system ATP-binding protein